MGDTEATHQQNKIGGAIGMILLAFALIYRFYPVLFHSESPPTQSEAKTNSPISAPTSQPLQSAATITVASTPEIPALDPLVLLGPPEAPVETAPPSKALVELLKKAANAVAEGRLVEPRDNNAYVLYQQVLAVAPNNSAAKAGLEQVEKMLFDQLHAALDRGDEAESMRLSSSLDAIAHNPAELESLRARLKTLKQVTPLLEQAAELLKQNHATEPAGANALEVYRQVLKLDATSVLADQGLAQIARIYLERALAAVAQDDFSGADSALAQAAQVRPASEELLDVRSRIEGVRRNRATSMLEQASSALDAGDAELAEQMANRALAMTPDLAGIDDFNQRLKNARLYSSLHPGQSINDAFLDRSGAAPTLIVIPTGGFIMGSPETEAGRRPNEEPQREVKISVGFALGRDEVTVAQFREFIKAGDYITDAQKMGVSSVYDESSGRMTDQRGVTWQDDYKGDHAADNLPVVHVSWNDANAYSEWLSARTGKRYRLPSEAEFEYALRAGSAKLYWWGDGNPTKILANVTGDGDRSPSHRSWTKAFPHYRDGYWGPAPVHSFPGNPLGVYDLDGNVSEWVEDCWHDNYLRAPRDSRAWVNPGCETHVARGGSWGSAPDQLRSAFRLAAPTTTSSTKIGIRVARDL